MESVEGGYFWEMLEIWDSRGFWESMGVTRHDFQRTGGDTKPRHSNFDPQFFLPVRDIGVKMEQNMRE